MLITPDVVLSAAADILDCYLHLERDQKPDAAEVAAIVEKHAHTILLEIGRGLGAIGAAWGHDVGLVFYHAELLDDAADPLYYLLMGCYGHGVCLGDNHEGALERAEGVLGSIFPVTFKPVPCHLDDSWLHEIVSEEEDTAK